MGTGQSIRICNILSNYSVTYCMMVILRKIGLMISILAGILIYFLLIASTCYLEAFIYLIFNLSWNFMIICNWTLIELVLEHEKSPFSS